MGSREQQQRGQRQQARTARLRLAGLGLMISAWLALGGADARAQDGADDPDTRAQDGADDPDARAQDSADSPDAGRAKDDALSRRLLEAARAALAAGELTRAQLLLLEAPAESPARDALLAQVHDRLYQCQQALSRYARLETARDLAPRHPLRVLARRERDRLAGCETWAQVTVTCGRGGRLFINGERLGQCVQRTHRLPPGPHVVRLERAGAAPREVRVDASPGRVQTLRMGDDGDGGLGASGIVAWSLVGSGALVLGAGLYFNHAGYQALVDVQAAADRQDSSARQEASDEVRFYQTLTGVALAVGLTSVGTGLTLLLIDSLSAAPSSEDASTGLRLGWQISAEAGLLTVQGSF